MGFISLFLLYTPNQRKMKIQPIHSLQTFFQPILRHFRNRQASGACLRQGFVQASKAQGVKNKSPFLLRIGFEVIQ